MAGFLCKFPDFPKIGLADYKKREPKDKTFDSCQKLMNVLLLKV